MLEQVFAVVAEEVPDTPEYTGLVAPNRKLVPADPPILKERSPKLIVRAVLPDVVWFAIRFVWHEPQIFAGSPTP